MKTICVQVSELHANNQTTLSKREPALIAHPMYSPLRGLEPIRKVYQAMVLVLVSVGDLGQKVPIS